MIYFNFGIYFCKILNSFFINLSNIFLFCLYSSDPEKMIYLSFIFFFNPFITSIPLGSIFVFILNNDLKVLKSALDTDVDKKKFCKIFFSK